MSIAREAVARAVDETAVQVRLGREGDRVQGEVEPAPALPGGIEDGLQLTRLLDVAGQENRRLQLLGDGLDVGLRLLVQVGERELGAEEAERRGAAVGDRLAVGDAEHDPLLAVERARRRIERQDVALGHGRNSAWAPPPRDGWRIVRPGAAARK